MQMKGGRSPPILVCKTSLAFRSKRLDVAITAISSFVVGKMNIWLEMVIHNNFVREVLAISTSSLSFNACYSLTTCAISTARITTVEVRPLMSEIKPHSVKSPPQYRKISHVDVITARVMYL